MKRKEIIMYGMYAKIVVSTLFLLKLNLSLLIVFFVHSKRIKKHLFISLNSVSSEGPLIKCTVS